MKVVFAIILTAISLSATAFFADVTPDQPHQAVTAATNTHG